MLFVLYYTILCLIIQLVTPPDERRDWNMNFPIALQLYSVREEMQGVFEGTLRKVRELG